MDIMNKTFTPELSPEVLGRLRDYAELFRDDFHHQSQRSWCGVYLRGLLEDGERKSIEPMASRVPRPPQLLDIKDPDQALQQFVNQSPWDEQQALRRYRRAMARPFASPRGIFVIDDTGFPKQGKRSVGVQHQYCGQLGKKANCQVAVTVHYVSPGGHFPAALRLFLPQSWTGSVERLERAGVPAEYRPARTKGQIALELLDQVRGEGLLPGDVVVTDAGYGASQDFRDGLEQRRMFYIAGVTSEMVVFTEEPRWDWPAGPAARGRPRSRPRLAVGSPRPVSLKSLAGSLPRHEVTWREGTKGKLSAKIRLGPGLAGPRLGRRCLCRRRADLAVDRGAGRRRDPVCLLEPAGGDEPAAGGPALEEPLAGGARLSADEGRTGAESFRGPVVARVPSPRLPGDAGLRLPGLGTTAREGGPGIAGDQKRARAEDHPAGDPPRLAAIPDTAGEAGLQLLQPLSSLVISTIP